MSLHADLRDGISRNELLLHYQPILDLESHAVVAHEAPSAHRLGVIAHTKVID